LRVPRAFRRRERVARPGAAPRSGLLPEPRLVAARLRARAGVLHHRHPAKGSLQDGAGRRPRRRGGMRIFLAMKADAELRSLEGVVSTLLERGHEVHLTVSTIKTPEAQAALDRFAEGRPGLTVGRLPGPARTPRLALTEDLRRTSDYLLYLDPAFDGAPKLRERRHRRAPPPAPARGDGA